MMVPNVVLPDGQKTGPNNMKPQTATEICNKEGSSCYGFLFGASTGVFFQHSFSVPKRAQNSDFYIKKDFAALFEKGMERKIVSFK